MIAIEAGTSARPAILARVVESIAALMLDLGASERAHLRRGPLPFELTRSIAEVEAGRSYVPGATVDQLLRPGDGIAFDGPWSLRHDGVKHNRMR